MAEISLYTKCITLCILPKMLLHEVETWTCTKTDKSKLRAVEMNFLRAVVEKNRRDGIKMHTLGESTSWREYRTKSGKVD